MENVKQVQELIKVYKDGFILEADQTGRSVAWLEGFVYAFERVDSLINEYLYGG